MSANMATHGYTTDHSVKMPRGMRTADIGVREKTLRSGRSSSYKSYNDYRVDSLENWTLDDPKNSEDIVYVVEQKVRKTTREESIENWTFDYDDSKEDSGFEDDLEFKRCRKYLQKKTTNVKSSIFIR